MIVRFVLTFLVMWAVIYTMLFIFNKWSAITLRNILRAGVVTLISMALSFLFVQLF
jgi:hypothetical protein